MYSALGIIAAAAISGIGAWIVARRRSSGHIETSEAADLWQAAETLRRELRDEVVALRQEVAVLRAESDECKETVRALTVRVHELEHPGQEAVRE